MIIDLGNTVPFLIFSSFSLYLKQSLDLFALAILVVRSSRKTCRVIRRWFFSAKFWWPSFVLNRYLQQTSTPKPIYLEDVDLLLEYLFYLRGKLDIIAGNEDDDLMRDADHEPEHIMKEKCRWRLIDLVSFKKFHGEILKLQNWDTILFLFFFGGLIVTFSP